MFKINQTREVWWPVKIRVPQDGGTVAEVAVRIKYKLAKRSEMQRIAALQSEFAEDDAVEFMARHITDWDGIVADNNEVLAYSPELLRALLEEAFVARSLAVGLFQASIGAPAKNS